MWFTNDHAGVTHCLFYWLIATVSFTGRNLVISNINSKLSLNWWVSAYITNTKARKASRWVSVMRKTRLWHHNIKMMRAPTEADIFDVIQRTLTLWLNLQRETICTFLSAIKQDFILQIKESLLSIFFRCHFVYDCVEHKIPFTASTPR